MRGLQYSASIVPTLKGLFSLHQIREISQICESFESSLTYHAAYLLAFYMVCSEFQMNLAQKSASLFNPFRHLLRADVAF